MLVLCWLEIFGWVADGIKRPWVFRCLWNASATAESVLKKRKGAKKARVCRMTSGWWGVACSQRSRPKAAKGSKGSGTQKFSEVLSIRPRAAAPKQLLQMRLGALAQCTYRHARLKRAKKWENLWVSAQWHTAVRDLRIDAAGCSRPWEQRERRLETLPLSTIQKPDF